MTIAYELGKTLEEVGGMSIDEFGKWIAYFNVQAERERRQKNGIKSRRN